MKQQTYESAFIVVNILYLYVANPLKFALNSTESSMNSYFLIIIFLIRPAVTGDLACVIFFLDVMNESLFPGILHPRL